MSIVNRVIAQRKIDQVRRRDVKTWFEILLFLDQLLEGHQHYSGKAKSYDYFQSEEGIILFFWDELDKLLIDKKIKSIFDASHDLNFKETSTRSDYFKTGIVSSSSKSIFAIGLSRSWKGRIQFFNSTFERGSEVYNNLSSSIWTSAMAMVQELTDLLLKRPHRFLVPFNVYSNPQSVPFTLACAIFSDLFSVPQFAFVEDGFIGTDPSNALVFKSSGSWSQFWSRPSEVRSFVEILFPWRSRFTFYLASGSLEFKRIITNQGIVNARVLFLTQKTNSAEILKHFNKAFYLSNNKAKIRKFVIDSNNAFKRKRAKKSEINHLLISKQAPYLPGISKIEYLVYLKSIADASYFRSELRDTRMFIFTYGAKIINSLPEGTPSNKILSFWFALEEMFCFFRGELSVVSDYSLSYRFRNKRYYPYRFYTLEELTGVAFLLAKRVFGKIIVPTNKQSVLLPDFQDALFSKKSKLKINHSRLFWDVLKLKKEIIWSVGIDALFELKMLVDILEKHPGKIDSIYFLIHMKDPFFKYKYKAFSRLKNESVSLSNLIRKYNIKMIFTDQVSAGHQIAAWPDKFREKMNRSVLDESLLIATGPSTFTLDSLRIDTFRMGITSTFVESKMMNLKKDSLFLLFVPAGLRPVSNFPVATQYGSDFFDLLNSNIFKAKVETFGLKVLLERLRQYAIDSGSDISHFFNPTQKRNSESIINVGGTHDDGSPYAGVILILKDYANLKFHALLNRVPKDVVTLANEFEKNQNKKVLCAWNGGYILNAELIARLSLPAELNGTPLGLVIENGRIISLPLFNKCAFCVGRDGNIFFREVNLFNGVTIFSRRNGKFYTFSAGQRNLEDAKITFFDGFFPMKDIERGSRVFYQFACNKVIGKHISESYVPHYPFGLLIAFPKNEDPLQLEYGDYVDFMVPGLVGIQSCVEAGPRLINNGKVSINMKLEGWKHPNSILTQAARVDSLELRGPKIAMGLTKDGQLMLLAINGRIRESVGVTHGELAKIMKENNIESAMGFDPGGSVTLVYEGKQLNITPYNKNFELVPLSLPPEPRGVGSAIIVY